MCHWRLPLSTLSDEAGGSVPWGRGLGPASRQGGRKPPSGASGQSVIKGRGAGRDVAVGGRMALLVWTARADLDDDARRRRRGSHEGSRVVIAKRSSRGFEDDGSALSLLVYRRRVSQQTFDPSQAGA